MKLGPFKIERANRTEELEKRIATLESQAVRVADLRQLAAQASGQAGNAGDGAFPFGPLSPLPPMGTPREQISGPRRWQYPVGTNAIFTPRAGEAVSFAALRNFARLYDIARICIQVRKEELQGLDWKIVARESGREDEYAADIAIAFQFFEKPDRRNTFDDWIALLLEDVFVIDAMTIHKQRTRGGELYALRAVDGATIHPVIDEVGEIYGYQQIIYGVPRTAYVDADYVSQMPNADQIETIFPIQELIYRPRVQIPDSLYGFPPLEWVLMTTNQAIRKQIADLAHFTDGNTPEALAPMPDGTSIEQALQFNDDFNALLAGDPRMRARLRFLPGGIDPSKIHEFRQFSTETTWDEMLVKKTCAAFGISPQEIGFTAQINKATGEMQENMQYRRSVEPLTQFFESLFDDILKYDLRMPHLKFTFHFGETEDELRLAQVDDIYLKNGAATIDQVRSKRHLGDPLGIDRPFVMTPAGPVYLDAALAQNNLPGEPAMPSVTHPVDSSPLPNFEITVASSTQADEDAALKSALGQWCENSLKRVRQGKLPRVDFESADISADIRDQLVARLGKTTTVEEVKAAFAAPFRSAREKAIWSRYP